MKAVDVDAGCTSRPTSPTCSSKRPCTTPARSRSATPTQLRWTITLDERPAADGGEGMVLGPDTVFVVTGAAGSIVSAITADLAAASGGMFHLLDLTSEARS